MSARKKPFPEAKDLVRATAKYLREHGLEPSDYIDQNDVDMLSGLVERGVSERGLRDFYKGGIKRGAFDDLRLSIRQLPREGIYALEEAGRFFQKDGVVQDFNPYLNPALGEFFEMPLSEYFPHGKTKGGGIRKAGKAILCASLIAALIGSAFASSYSPSSETTKPYPAFDYNDKKLLDKNHNSAVSLPEMLGGLGNHGFGSIGSYIGHTFFFANLDNDGDKIIDSDEKNVYHTDPNKADTDSDGLNDNLEIFETKSDPLKKDTDGDGLDDNLEWQKIGTNPLNPDTLGKGFGDYYESTHLHASKTSKGTDIFGCSHIYLCIDRQLEGKIREATLSTEIKKMGGGVIEKQEIVKDKIEEKFRKSGSESACLEVEECDHTFCYLLDEFTATLEVETTEPVSVKSLST